MSQYAFRNDDHDFICGWDERLTYHFLSIFDRGTGDVVFSNLHLPDPQMRVEDIAGICRRFGEPLPELIQKKLEVDSTKRADPNLLDSRKIVEFMRTKTWDLI